MDFQPPLSALTDFLVVLFSTFFLLSQTDPLLATCREVPQCTYQSRYPPPKRLHDHAGHGIPHYTVDRSCARVFRGIPGSFSCSPYPYSIFDVGATREIQCIDRRLHLGCAAAGAPGTQLAPTRNKSAIGHRLHKVRRLLSIFSCVCAQLNRYEGCRASRAMAIFSILCRLLWLASISKPVYVLLVLFGSFRVPDYPSQRSI